MRYLLWAMGIACMMTFISVMAEANDADVVTGEGLPEIIQSSS